MGIHERDWYRDHLRRATYTPKAFRRDRSVHHASSAASATITSFRHTLPALVLWLAIGAVAVFGFSRLLAHHAPKVVQDSVLPVGVSAGRLRIAVENTSAATKVELLQVGPTNAPTGVVWTLSVAAGRTADYDIPDGRYRVRVQRTRGWLPPVVDELPTVIEFAGHGTQVAGGTLRI